MNIEKIPQQLRERRQWVLWKYVTRDGNPTKVPFSPNGKPAKSDDSATWSALEDCVPHIAKYEGVGFELSAVDPYVGIDLDGCREPETGEVEPWAKEIIKAADSYSEVSPSGTGVKIFVRGEWPHGGRKKQFDTDGEVCEKTPGIEVYAERRYFAVTSIRIKGISPVIEERQEFLDWLYREHFKPAAPVPRQAGSHRGQSEIEIVERARKYVEKMDPAVSGQGGHNATFTVACRLVLGFGLNEGDALFILREYNQRCSPPWSERELQHKVKQAAKQPGERNYLRDAKPEQWESISVPSYRSSEPPLGPSKEVKVTTLWDATQVYQESLNEERDLISTGIAELDYAIGGGYDLGELIVLAARPSHGKSAVALQLVHSATEQQIPTFVLSQEMSVRSIGKRVIQYVSKTPEEYWRTQDEVVRDHLRSHFSKRAEAYLIESVENTDRAIEEIEKAIDEHGVKLVVVDYAQLLSNKGKGRYEQVTNTSMQFRHLATRRNVAVLLLCQLNRAIEARPKFIPVMSDLKESGQIEQDADVILFLVWPHRIDSSNPAKQYCVFVSKNRNRAINQAALRMEFNPSRQRIQEERSQQVEDRLQLEDETFDRFNQGEF